MYMQRLSLILLLAILFCFFIESIQAQTYIEGWGLTDRGKGWPILNDSSTAAGDASMGADAPPPTWATIRGGFGIDVEVTTDEAIIVTGQLEYVGDGAGLSYVPLRYALTYQQDEGILENQYTDSAAWSVAGGHYGYEFTPKSGPDYIYGYGRGTVWTIINGNWNSTYSNNGWAIAPDDQIPRHAEIVEGVYDWAISVQPLGDGTNEVRWYLIHEDKVSYWYGGITIDTAQVTTKFNGICFGIGDGISTNLTRFNLFDVRVEKGEPIEIPPAPWEPYYIDQWGIADYHGWPILNDSSTAAGEASIGSETKDGWASLRGSFGQTVEASLDSAVIVRGQLEFVGGGLGLSGNAGLRYALTWQENEGILENQYTDSAAWSATGDHYGYEFTPNSGYLFSYIGTVWTIIDSNWASTWSNNGWAISYVYQVPYSAEIVEGVYDWAISVQPLADGTNEVRWYLQHEDKESYWFAGIAIDTAQVTTIFNGICFGIGSIVSETLTQFNLTQVQIDKGDPIKIPPAPWEPYYIDQWGIADYHGWPILNDSTTKEGYASIGGESRDGIASLRGSFGQDVPISKEKAILVSGQIEFIGGSGGDDYFPIRYALIHQADEGELRYVGTDSMQWSVSGDHSGYAFHPRTGKGIMSNGPGGYGTVWTIINGNWAHVWQGGSWPIAAVNQAPRNAEIVADVYDFAISVHAVDSTTNEIRWYMVEENENYWFGGIVQDTAATKMFNGIEFGINGSEYTQFNVIDMQVDLGDPIVVPPKPWADYYVDEWGFIGNRVGGWTNEPGKYVGDFTLSGENPPTDWSAVRGGFYDSVELTAGEIIVVEGDIVFEGGGFQDWSSLRLGLFYSDSAGTAVIDSALDSSWVWTGTETHHSGYLFLPHSGMNDFTTWSGTDGIYGGIADGNWISTNNGTGYVLGQRVQVPAGAVAGAATYAFKMGVGLLADGTAYVVMQLRNGDDYIWEAYTIDDNDPLVTTKFNCVCFAISNSTTTAMHLQNVLVRKGIFTDLEKDVFDLIPAQYSLSQNYPNPFNPVTTIKYSIPYSSFISLKVYNVLGQEVCTLFEGKKQVGAYTVLFDGSGLSTGIYFYRLETKDFMETKKLVLIK